MEEVYVLPAHRFPPASSKLIPLKASLLQEIEESGRFMPRPRAEQDPSYRQIIPYALVKYQNSYFLMRRTRGGGEARLHDLYTLGVGGHINPGDEIGSPLLDGLRRELWEEVGIEHYLAEPVGFIVMRDSPVSMVHAGVVFVVEPLEEPRVMEVEKLEGRLASLEEIRAIQDKLEGWSQVVLDWLVSSHSAQS